MRPATRIKQELLQLPAAERAELVLEAWASLEADLAFAADPDFDPEGVELAIRRNQEIESGAVTPLSDEEFWKRVNAPRK
jgi:hypothetical protein